MLEIIMHMTKIKLEEINGTLTELVSCLQTTDMKISRMLQWQPLTSNSGKRPGNLFSQTHPSFIQETYRIHGSMVLTNVVVGK